MQNFIFGSRQKEEEWREGERILPLLGAAHGPELRVEFRRLLPGSELLHDGSLKQQTCFLFRLLLFHWCFSIYLSDQVIKDLKMKKTQTEKSKR